MARPCVSLDYEVGCLRGGRLFAMTLIAANCLMGVCPPLQWQAIVLTGICPCGRLSDTRVIEYLKHRAAVRTDTDEG